MNALLRQIDLPRAALLVIAAGFATIAGAWAYEHFGYAPCDLCLKQRWAYYAGLPLAAVALVAYLRGARGLAATLLALVAAMFAANAIFAFYHSGVEAKLWPGPAGCTGGFNPPASLEDFRNQLKTVHVVRCDEAALRVLGLSLANWNVLISGALAIVACVGVRQPPDRSVAT